MNKRVLYSNHKGLVNGIITTQFIPAGVGRAPKWVYSEIVLILFNGTHSQGSILRNSALLDNPQPSYTSEVYGFRGM